MPLWSSLTTCARPQTSSVRSSLRQTSGGAKRANSYAKFLGVPMVICHKSRAKANEVAEMTIIGDVTDKDVILVDDIVDTAGTICKAADLMIQNGARSVRAVASHAVLSDPATERINASALKEMIFTDSIPLRKHSDKIHIVSVANIFAEAINRVINHESISILTLSKGSPLRRGAPITAPPPHLWRRGLLCLRREGL